MGGSNIAVYCFTQIVLPISIAPSWLCPNNLMVVYMQWCPICSLQMWATQYMNGFQYTYVNCLSVCVLCCLSFPDPVSRFPASIDMYVFLCVYILIRVGKDNCLLANCLSIKIRGDTRLCGLTIFLISFLYLAFVEQYVAHTFLVICFSFVYI